jgi:sec-independent protein translocase protein TatA
MSSLAPFLGLITFGVWEAIFVFGIVLLLFGAKKLPLLARGLGHGFRNFKGELQTPPEEEPPEERD